MLTAGNGEGADMPVIEVTDLTKAYSGTTVVDRVSFSVDEGEIFGIVGPNGAGKTTTVEAIEGLRTPDSGTIQVLGMDPMADHYELAQRVGAQLQESRLQAKVKVGEVMDVYASFYRNPADWHQLLDRLGLNGKIDANYASLSGGQKQRLSVALALVGSPEIAILDELTTGLDPQARRSTWDTIEEIRDSGVTVVLVTHFMEEAERLCDRIMVMDQGHIVALDSPAGLVDRIGSEQRLTFRPSAPISDEDLETLPGVTSVSHAGSKVVVAGIGNVVHAVTSLLAQRGVIAEDLRIDQTSLEDAYLTLTGGTEPLGSTDQEDN